MSRTVLLFLALGLEVSLTAQSQTPRFEVASIKQQAGATYLLENMLASSPRPQPGGVFEQTRITVETLIGFAYDRQRFQIIGGPQWIRQSIFEIKARAGRDVTTDDVKLMVQSLLEDRFHLAAHHEQRDMRVQALVRAGAGDRFGPLVAKISDCAAENIKAARQQIPSQPTLLKGFLMSGCGKGFVALLPQISLQLGAPVIDATGVNDTIFAEVRYGASPAGASTAASEADPNFPPLNLALQEQLGVKLEERRGPIDVLVIDSIQQPTEI